jgi:hypothetical protein
VGWRVEGLVDLVGQGGRVNNIGFVMFLVINNKDLETRFHLET